MILMEHIVREGHPALRKRAEEVHFPLSEDDRKLSEDLLEYVINSQNPEICEQYGLRPGIGLSRTTSECFEKNICTSYYRRRS